MNIGKVRQQQCRAEEYISFSSRSSSHHEMMGACDHAPKEKNYFVLPKRIIIGEEMPYSSPIVVVSHISPCTCSGITINCKIMSILI